MGEWISVKDRLPDLVEKEWGYSHWKESEWVVVLTMNKDLGFARRKITDYEGEYWVTNFGNREIVENWMPLPDDPTHMGFCDERGYVGI